MRNSVYLLIRHSLIAIFREDDATINEAMLLQEVLHDVVVPMSVYADVA